MWPIRVCAWGVRRQQVAEAGSWRARQSGRSLEQRRECASRSGSPRPRGALAASKGSRNSSPSWQVFGGASLWPRESLLFGSVYCGRQILLPTPARRHHRQIGPAEVLFIYVRNSLYTYISIYIYGRARAQVHRCKSAQVEPVGANGLRALEGNNNQRRRRFIGRVLGAK